MKVIKQFAFVVFFALSTKVYGKKSDVREIFTNGREMKTIYLSMGRSTVLSFTEKPIKVVAGNSNYFNVEFIGNDLTIQPLAQVESNLFIYLQSKNKFGFHLKVGSVQKSDDLVYVRYKSEANLLSPRQSQVRPKKILTPFSVDLGKVELKVKELFPLGEGSTYVLDFAVASKSKKSFLLKEIKTFISQNGNFVKGQKLFFEKDSLEKLQTCRGRIFFSISNTNRLTFVSSNKGKVRRMDLSKRFR